MLLVMLLWTLTPARCFNPSTGPSFPLDNPSLTAQRPEFMKAQNHPRFGAPVLVRGIKSMRLRKCIDEEEPLHRFVPKLDRRSLFLHSLPLALVQQSPAVADEQVGLLSQPLQAGDQLVQAAVSNKAKQPTGQPADQTRQSDNQPTSQSQETNLSTSRPANNAIQTAADQPSSTPANALPPIEPDAKYVRFNKLNNRYILLRPGETLFEAADIVDSCAYNKAKFNRGMTPKGFEQVRDSAAKLNARGIIPARVFYDNGARAIQTADVIEQEMKIPRSLIDPEFRWLEARAMGAFEGTPLQEAKAKLREIDKNYQATPPDTEIDGVESNSLADVLVRMQNTIMGCEYKFNGQDIIIIGGDSTVLSVFAAAAIGVDLSEHYRFELPPGGFFYLPDLMRDCREGKFSATLVPPPTEESIAAGRAVLRDIGPSLFTETEAGSWVTGGRR